MLTGPILIAGTGALGSVMGGMLRAAGYPVALLGRRAHLDAVARRGLIVDGLFGRREVGGFELFTDLEALRGRRFRLILVTVKSYDSAEIAPHLAGLLGEDGVAVAAQNGLGNLEILARHLGPGQVLGARVIFGAQMEAAGSARVTVFAEPVAIGPAPDLSGAASQALQRKAGQIASALSDAGIPAHPVADIRPWLWTKLFYNAALNPLGALLNLNYGALGEDPGLRRIMDAIVTEAFAIAQAAQVRVPYQSSADYLAAFYGRLLPATFHHRPSMLADLQHRGRTEIGSLNGALVAMADRMGLGAEMNRTVTALIRARERLWQPPPQEYR
jgi:2-dehydropantoate 2-reductase